MDLAILYKWQFWLVLAIAVIVILWLCTVNNKRRRKSRRDQYENSSEDDDIPEPMPNLSEIVSYVPPPQAFVTQMPTSSVQQQLIDQPLAVLPPPSTQLPGQQFSPPFAQQSPHQQSIGDDSETGTQLCINVVPEIPEGISADDWLDDGKTSAGEKECRRVLEKIYGVPFRRVRPPWLTNDKTGRRMELDGYNESLKIAFEYNSEYHYREDHNFNKSRKAFLDLVYRDTLKVDTCDRKGVYLITVPYTVTLANIEGYIRYYLPEAVAARLRRLQLTSGH